jgi:phage terminase small subunit
LVNRIGCHTTHLVQGKPRAAQRIWPIPYEEDTTISTDLDGPPRPLSIAARQVWDRHARRIYGEGRWAVVDHDLLCLYAETLELYLRFKADIDDHGTLVQGRTLQERVKNPSLQGLSNARADMVRLAKWESYLINTIFRLIMQKENAAIFYGKNAWPWPRLFHRP